MCDQVRQLLPHFHQPVIHPAWPGHTVHNLPSDATLPITPHFRCTATSCKKKSITLDARGRGRRSDTQSAARTSAQCPRRNDRPQLANRLTTHDTTPSGARESSNSRQPRAAYILRGFRVELLDMRVREREGERG